MTNKRLSALLAALVGCLLYMILFTGCYTKNQAVKKFCRPELFNKDTTLTIIHHDTVFIAADSVMLPFNCDSISKALQGQITEVTLYNDSLYRIVVTRVDGKPTLKTIFKDRIIPVHDTIAVKVTIPGTVIHDTLPLTWWQIALMTGGVLLPFALIFLVLVLVRKR